MQQLTAPELAAWIADPSRENPVLLDVREEREYQICHIEGSLLIPMNTIPARLSEMACEALIVCICHHGTRSMQVGMYLEQNGFTQITNLTGGIHAWAGQVDPAMPTY